MGEDEQELVKLKKEEEKQMTAIDKQMQEQEKLKQNRVISKSKADDIEGEVSEIKKRLTAQNKEITTLQKAINALDTKLEQKRADRHSLLKTCKVRQCLCLVFIILTEVAKRARMLKMYCTQKI